METTSDKIRAFAWAMLFHVGCVLLMFAGLWWTESTKAVNAAGEPVIQATLVDLGSMKITPKVAPPKPKPVESIKPIETPKPPQPKPDSSLPPKPVSEQKPLPPVPPRADNNRNQDEVRRLGQLAAENERREQEERRKREQEVLEQEESANKMESERIKQLADIRRMREQAEARRKAEEQKLSELRAQRDQQLADRNPTPPAPRAGTGGTDESLLASYVSAIQASVTEAWLRPDYVEQIRCKVEIVQIPGGEVISATVAFPCNGDDATKRSVETAVLRASPLPYSGFESVFNRRINFMFCYPEGTLCSQ